MATEETFDIEEKHLDPILVAGVRMRGPYSACGQGFARIGKSLGRYICGKPLCLYYDAEYRPDDADIEPCMPLRTAVEAEGIEVRELPGGRCVSLVHKGPYEELHNSYKRIRSYCAEQDYAMQVPSREVYLKGPGMLFKGDPKKYLTEIQILID